jgi:hypothetical protein
MTKTLYVPTILDEVSDFEPLFALSNEVGVNFSDVTFNFEKCHSLRPNVVAFLGGLARLIESRQGKVSFDWDSAQPLVLQKLTFNGFATLFGGSHTVIDDHSIPYREDLLLNRGDLPTLANQIIDYLTEQWLGKGWIHISPRLRDAIVGNVWEIYANAFDHAESPIGVFSCGQHYQTLGSLQLTTVDFGKGIPANVKQFFNNTGIPASKCLEWAFQEGKTTKPSISRGMGLDLLKEFIKINHGKLEVYSYDSHALIDKDRESYETRETCFEGTLINITLVCDELFYKFASEVLSEPLF